MNRRSGLWQQCLGQISARFPRTEHGGSLRGVQVWHPREVPRCWAQPCPCWAKADVERGCGASVGCGLGAEPVDGAPGLRRLVVLVRRFGSGAPGGEGRLPSFGSPPAALPLQSLGPCCRRTGEA